MSIKDHADPANLGSMRPYMKPTPTSGICAGYLARRRPVPLLGSYHVSHRSQVSKHAYENSSRFRRRCTVPNDDGSVCPAVCEWRNQTEGAESTLAQFWLRTYWLTWGLSSNWTAWKTLHY